MEEVVAVGMSTSMMMLIAILLFVYRKLIFRSAELGEVVMTRALDAVEDTTEVYVNTVHIMNSEKRADQAKQISEIETIVTNKDIRDMLQARVKEAKAKKPVAQAS